MLYYHYCYYDLGLGWGLFVGLVADRCSQNLAPMPYMDQKTGCLLQARLSEPNLKLKKREKILKKRSCHVKSHWRCGCFESCCQVSWGTAQNNKRAIFVGLVAERCSQNLAPMPYMDQKTGLLVPSKTVWTKSEAEKREKIFKKRNCHVKSHWMCGCFESCC